MNQTLPPNSYKKASKRLALLSLMVFLAVISVIAYNATRLNAINATISEHETEVETRMKTIDELNEEVERLRYASVQKPNAHAEELPDIRDARGRQIYDFMLWIDVSAFLNKDILEVRYASQSRDLGLATSTDRTNGFSVSFRGAECLDNIRVTLLYRNGAGETLDFNMCEALGW